jgi:PAS domain-containing protein
MMRLQARSWRSATSALLPVVIAGLAAGVFVAEAITSMKLVVDVCYVVVVLLAARFSSARGIVLVGAGCVGLTLLAFLLPGFSETEAGGTGVKASISAAVIGLTTFLVTEQKRAAEALRESEEQWREVFEHNPVMYFIVGPIGTVLLVNAFGAAQLGYTAAELIGQSVLNVFSRTTESSLKAVWQPVCENSAVRIAGRSAKSARTARRFGYVRMPRRCGGRVMMRLS